MSNKMKGAMCLMLDAAVAFVGMAIAFGGINLIANDTKVLTGETTPKAPTEN